MKKQYIKPAEKEYTVFPTPLMLTVSGGDSEEEIIGNSNGRRGKWGDLWGEDEE